MSCDFGTDHQSYRGQGVASARALPGHHTKRIIANQLGDWTKDKVSQIDKVSFPFSMGMNSSTSLKFSLANDRPTTDENLALKRRKESSEVCLWLFSFLSSSNIDKPTTCVVVSDLDYCALR